MNATVRRRPGGYATIEVATRGGAREVDAQIIGPLCVHRRPFHSHTWSLTHVRTGCALAVFAHRADAQTCARALRLAAETNDVDLDTPDPREAAALIKSIDGERTLSDHGGSQVGTAVDADNYAPFTEAPSG